MGRVAYNLSFIETLTEEIDRLDERIEKRAEGLEVTRLLMSTPGVSHYSALVIYAELGDIDRFDRAKEVVRYVGLNPIVRESGDSRFEGGISKNGPGKVRWLLVQAVHSAVHTGEDPYLSRFSPVGATEEQPESCGGDRSEVAGLDLSHVGSG